MTLSGSLKPKIIWRRCVSYCEIHLKHSALCNLGYKKICYSVVLKYLCSILSLSYLVASALLFSPSPQLPNVIRINQTNKIVLQHRNLNSFHIFTCFFINYVIPFPSWAKSAHFRVVTLKWSHWKMTRLSQTIKTKWRSNESKKWYLITALFCLLNIWRHCARIKTRHSRRQKNEEGRKVDFEGKIDWQQDRICCQNRIGNGFSISLHWISIWSVRSFSGV